MNLSLCMIARDSALTIAAALNGVAPFVDEMVVVDTGSLDDTPAIAAACGARVHHFPWCDDFAAARNQSLRLARGRWLFWMDTDDIIDAANGRALRALADAEHKSELMGFVMQVHCPPAGAEAAYRSAVVVDHVKLIRNHPDIRFSGRIHEQILPAIRRLGGTVAWSDIAVVHSGADRSPEGRRRKNARDLRLLHLQLADDPDNSFALFNLGMTLLDAGDTEAALLQLCRALQLAVPGESHLVKLHALLVQAYQALGRRQTALTTCLHALRLFPDDPELLYRRGVLQQSMGQLDAAEQAFAAAVAPRQQRQFASLDQGFFGAKAWHNLAVVRQARGQAKPAAQAWRQAVTLDPASRAAWWGLLSASLAAPEAAGIADIMPGLPDHADIRRAAEACRCIAAGDGPRALALLEPALTEDASPDLREFACRVAFQCEAWATAEAWLTDLTRISPGDAPAWLNLAIARYRLGEHAAALDAVDHSLAIRPNHTAAQRLQAELRPLVAAPAGRA